MKATPRRNRLADIDRCGRSSAVDEHLAAVDGIGTRDRAHDLGAAGTDQSGEPDDLTGAHREADLVENGRRAANPRTSRRTGASPRDGGELREMRVEATADHGAR